eukprot:scaffold32997_cov101-Isochrysis_galbana.AAC.2
MEGGKSQQEQRTKNNSLHVATHRVGNLAKGPHRVAPSVQLLLRGHSPIPPSSIITNLSFPKTIDTRYPRPTDHTEKGRV